MTMQVSDVAGLVTQYARRLHEVAGGQHHVASPLGAWLLLALCGPATHREERRALEDVLGCGVEQAASVAGELLERPHPLVGAAAAVWNRGRTGDPRWLAGLPAAVERGPIPSQDEADAWVREHTFGLIETFPLWEAARYDLLLASAIATKVSWDRPFEPAPGSELGEASPWSKEVKQVLASPQHRRHKVFLANTTEVGEVGVHVGRAQDGLIVASVIAACDVPAVEVLATAHGIAIDVALNRSVAMRSLFDLPLGDGPFWSVREEMSPDGPGERCRAVLPAWEARSVHDLANARLGFAAAAGALGGGDSWEAKQAAMARYTRFGFEAAAVTAMGVLLSARPPGKLRIGELRFGHPYAVIAVASSDPDAEPEGADDWPDQWNGLPVFSAWVAKPGEAE
ncbi:MAG TPA: hypothetical protein VHJ18_25450 [Streptosporangiaceae bacterium]|nr:hypothetical protein [Streptosporangiaceae bacterium]